MSGLANRLSSELATANADSEAARLAETQMSAQLSLQQQQAQLAKAKLEAEQQLAAAAVWTTATSYGETLVPRQWLSSVSEELEERTVTYKNELAVMTSMVDVSAGLQAELQQRQSIMEETVIAKLRMVAVGHAASRIQFAFLRYRLRSHKVDADKLRRTGRTLRMAVQLAEQERDVERQTLTQTLGQAQEKAQQTTQAYEATLAELHALRTSSAEALSRKVEEITKKQEIDKELAVQHREREWELRAHSLERALVAASARWQRQRSASKIQRSYRNHRSVLNVLAEQQVGGAATAQSELSGHTEQGTQLRNTLEGSPNAEAFAVAQKSTSVIVPQLVLTDSSDSGSDDSGIISYTTGLGSLSTEYIHPPSPGHSSIVITGQRASSAAHDDTHTVRLSNRMPQTTTDELGSTRNSLASLLGTQGVTTSSLLKTNKLEIESPVAAQAPESNTLRSRLDFAEASLKAMQTEFKTLLAELTRECEMVTFYAWLGPEPRLSSYYSFHQGSWRTIWRELREAALRLCAGSRRTTQEDKAHQNLEEELSQLKERVAEAEREAENAQLAATSKEIHLRLKEEDLNAYAQEIEDRATGWEDEHAAAVHALEKRAMELKHQHQAAVAILHSELEESRLEREAVRFEQMAHSGHPSVMSVQSDENERLSATAAPQTVPESVMALELPQDLGSDNREISRQDKATNLHTKTTKVARMTIAEKNVSDWVFVVSKTAPSVIGRTARKTDADCVLPGTAADKGISRKHAWVEYVASNDEFALTCLGINVVKVNNQVIDAAHGAISLKDGDRLRFGSAEVVFGVTEEPVVPEPEPEPQLQSQTISPATLTLADNTSTDWVFELSKSAVSTIGRGAKPDCTEHVADCALPGTIGEKSISRKHAQIEYSAGGDKFMLSAIGSNVVHLNHDRLVDANHGPIMIKDGDLLSIGSRPPIVLRVNIPAPFERGNTVKQLVRTFTPQAEEAVTHTASKTAVIKDQSDNTAPDSQERSHTTIAERLMHADSDLDAVLEGIETSFLRAEAERCILQERKANHAQLEEMQIRINAAESTAAAAVEDSNNYAAKISQLNRDLEKSTEIASTAIAEASRLRAALQEKHGKDGQQVLRLSAELDAANKVAETAQRRNLELTAQLDQAMKDAIRMKEEFELEVGVLQLERDEAKYQAQLSASEAIAWAHINPYSTEQPPTQPASQPPPQAQVDEDIEVKLQKFIMQVSNTGSVTGGGTGLKAVIGTEDVGPAAYEKQLKSAMSQAEQLLAADTRQKDLQVRAAAAAAASASAVTRTSWSLCLHAGLRLYRSLEHTD